MPGGNTRENTLFMSDNFLQTPPFILLNKNKPPYYDYQNNNQNDSRLTDCLINQISNPYNYKGDFQAIDIADI